MLYYNQGLGAKPQPKKGGNKNEEAIFPYAEFIAAAREGFPDADSYNPEDFSGLSIDEAAAEIEQEDALIAKITAQQIIIFPNEMGIAGEFLFGLREE